MDTMKAFHRLHALRQENDAHRYTMDAQRSRFERIANRHANGTAPRAVVAHQLFQTPPALVQRRLSLADLAPGLRVLEPSAGLGRILDGLHEVQTVAVEISPTITAELYRQEREGVRILQRDFLALDPAELPLFDRVVMNPPFTMRADIRHISHALTFLRPGGVLVALAMDTPQREAALRPIAEEWHHIEPGTFRAEGTGVGCVLMKIRQP
jgi:SAM-dependent methyltransferase